MSYKKSIVILIFSFLFFLPFLATAQNIEYQTLAPIDGYVKSMETIEENGRSFGTYLDNMFKLGIALCTGLAVIMIIVGGIQYVSSDAWSKKSDGKERIIAALFGLLIALGSYALLNTINPNLLNTSLDLEPLELVDIEQRFAALSPEQKEYVETGKNGPSDTLAGTGQPGVTPTGTHQDMPPSVPLKPGIGGQIDSSMASGLQNMNTELNAAGINWRVTEAYPPTREHKADCHKNGTCIDANFTNGGSAEQVKTFIQVANNNGFRAVYEVKTKEERDSLVAAGVPADRVKNLGGWISGSHFSVYNKN